MKGIFILLAQALKPTYCQNITFTDNMHSTILYVHLHSQNQTFLLISKTKTAISCLTFFLHKMHQANEEMNSICQGKVTQLITKHCQDFQTKFVQPKGWLSAIQYGQFFLSMKWVFGQIQVPQHFIDTDIYHISTSLLKYNISDLLKLLQVKAYFLKKGISI